MGLKGLFPLDERALGGQGSAGNSAGILKEDPREKSSAPSTDERHSESMARDVPACLQRRQAR
jgi:hypothetical protein